MSTDKPIHDVLPGSFRREDYYVVITKPVLVETGDEAVSREISRGIYGFSSFKRARSFKTSCNTADPLSNQPPVAYLFKRHHHAGEEE